MKRGLLVLAIAIFLGVCMFFCSRFMASGPISQGATTSFMGETDNMLPELDWFKRSLHLTEGQYEKVKALHLAYRPKCEDLCERIQLSDAALLATARKRDVPATELTAALRARVDVLLECQQAMLAHVHQTASCMEPKQADQYLDIVLPYVLGMYSSCHGSRSP